jgi:hypothetical protein
MTSVTKNLARGRDEVPNVLNMAIIPGRDSQTVSSAGIVGKVAFGLPLNGPDRQFMRMLYRDCCTVP